MKILIIRFSSIGDIVLTTPIIRCLKTQLPEGTQIHYLTKPGYASLLESNPHIDQIALLQAGLWQTAKAIRGEKFDYIVDLHNNLRTFILKILCGVPSSKFNKLNFSKWLITMLKVNVLPEQHIVDRYFKAVNFFKIVNDGRGLDFFLKSDWRQIVSKQPGLENPKFITMAIGGQHETKKMPFEKLCEIIALTSLPIAILGGKEDAEIANRLENKFPNQIIHCAGKFSIAESAEIINQSALLVSHDTGMMHIGAALKKTVYAVWGNTIPQFGMYPYYGDSEIEFRNFEVQGLKCRPCSKIGYESCPKRHFKCMMHQDSHAIAGAINSFNQSN